MSESEKVAEAPVKATVSRRAAIGMMAGGAAAGVIGAKVGQSSSTSGNYEDIIDARGYAGNCKSDTTRALGADPW